MRTAVAVAGLVLFALACEPPPPDPDGGGGCGTGPGSVEVGRGGSRPVALSDGDGLPIVLGAQGGIHVVVAAWVRDMDLDLTLRYRLVDDEGALVGTETAQALRPSLFMPAGDRYVRHPDLVVLDNDAPSVERFAGREATLEVEAVSVDGSHACDARRVRLDAP